MWKVFRLCLQNFRIRKIGHVLLYVCCKLVVSIAFSPEKAFKGREKEGKKGSTFLSISV